MCTLGGYLKVGSSPRCSDLKDPTCYRVYSRSPPFHPGLSVVLQQLFREPSAQPNTSASPSLRSKSSLNLCVQKCRRNLFSTTQKAGDLPLWGCPCKYRAAWQCLLSIHGEKPDLYAYSSSYADFQLFIITDVTALKG